MIRIERHEQGPRLFVLGTRLHECALGLAVLAVLLLGRLAGVVHDVEAVAVAAALGSWLLVKDWRDLFPSKRDTAHWRVGLHSERPREKHRGRSFPGRRNAVSVSRISATSCMF